MSTSRPSSVNRYSWWSDVAFLLALASFLGCLHHAIRADRPLFVEPENAAYVELTAVGAVEVRSLLGKPQVMLVDARPEAIHRKDTIPGSISLPVHTSIADSLLSRLQIASDVIVFCSGPHCRAAQDLAVELRERGVPQVRVFSGGMQAWRERRYPLASGGP